MAGGPEIKAVTGVFVLFETRDGSTAWGCTVAHPALSEDDPEDVIQACEDCADMVPDLHPTNIEYSLAQLAPQVKGAPSALCAFDLAFHDLLGKRAGMPLYRLLGGYRASIPTSITIPIGPVGSTVARAKKHAAQGFRILKIKGGLDPDEDVQRVRAVQRALPNLTLRLDADGGYAIRDAISVARALEGTVEMLEQPTSPEDVDALGRVTENSRTPILADQTVTSPESALEVTSRRRADGLSVKVACCGGLLPARQIEVISRVARIRTMVSCLIEPALLIAAGLGLALSSPNVAYADLDGHLSLSQDPSRPMFRIQDGEMIASESPGLGCDVDLGR
jgi:L-alanine-DL-glutamate epimerase-like enolase superfamily enzyme